ncbi:MAG TPA: permease prefix domain 1-containing protein [Fimbriimonadaceae bacterium]|nr:permease prefix domain 1-containing protein [Fimbriimonadaceae bacterium]
MASRLDTYMDRLGKRIGGKLPQEETGEHLREIRQHLDDSRAALVRNGMTEEAAETETLRQIGSDRLLAEGLIREHRGYGVRSPWRLGLLPAVILLAGLALPAAFVLWLPMAFAYFDWIVWLPATGTLLFLLACLRFRRILLLPLAAVLGVSLIAGVVAVALGPSGVTAHSATLRKENLAGFDREIARLKGEYETAQTATTAAVLPASLARGPGSDFLAPVVSDAPEYERSFYNPIGRQVGVRPRADLMATPREEAVRLWRKNGRFYASQLLGEIGEQQSYRAVWTKSAGSWSVVGQAAWSELLFGLRALIFFGLLNLGALGALRARDRAIQSRWRPERIA